MADDRQFSQDEVNRLLGKTRSEARRAAIREVMDKLGMSVDEAAAVIDRAENRELTEPGAA